MKIVIDSNRIIAAIIKDSTTRQILLNKKFEFIAPSYVFSEITKYKDYITRKVNINSEEFDTLLSLIFENINIIKASEYDNFIKKLKNEVSDSKDIPYLAVAVFTEAKGIWTHDIHFKEQNKIEIFANMDMLKLIKEKN